MPVDLVRARIEERSGFIARRSGNLNRRHDPDAHHSTAARIDIACILERHFRVGRVQASNVLMRRTLNRITDVEVSNKSLGVGGGLALMLATAPVLLFVAVTTPWATRSPGALAPTTRDIGNAFLTKWLLPFELASLILLATLIGAIVIARKELKPDEEPAL